MTFRILAGCYRFFQINIQSKMNVTLVDYDPSEPFSVQP
jgi:hypothetical protein